MDLLIMVLALYALGPLAARFRHASRDRLRSAEERLSAEGFAYVVDVPGAEAGLSVQEAARAFSVAGGAREATCLKWGGILP